MRLANLIVIIIITIQFISCNFSENLWDTYSSDVNSFRVIETYPKEGQVINPENTLTVFFNNELRISSITSDCIVVYDMNPDPMVKINGQLFFDNDSPKSITFIPDSTFINSDFTILVKSTIKDINGEELGSITTINFKVNSAVTLRPEITKILPDLNSPVKTTGKIKVFFNVAMDTSSYLFSISSEATDLSFITHYWGTDDNGDGVVFKFEPILPDEFEENSTIDVVLEDFQSAGSPTVFMTPNPYIFSFNVGTK